MPKETRKNYDRIPNKLRQNFEDVQYLIALHIQVLEKIKVIEAKMDRLWSSITTIHEDTREDV